MTRPRGHRALRECRGAVAAGFQAARRLRPAGVAAGALLGACLAAAGCGSDENPAAPSRPTAPPVAISGPFAAELRAFDAQDAATPFPPGGVVFVGSSSIRFWNLALSFPGRNYLNRGFGGSQISDSITYVELLVLRHAPQAVAFYAGDNDIAAGKTPTRVADDFATLTERIHAELPATRILFLAIKPSIARWALIDQIRTANQLIADYCSRDSRLTYVDVHTPMIGPDGMPRSDLLVSDGLHLSAAGYALWTLLVRPHLPAGGMSLRANPGRGARPAAVAARSAAVAARPATVVARPELQSVGLPARS